MKTNNPFSACIVCIVIMAVLSGCAPTKVKKKDCTIDVVLCSNFESASLPEDLQNLYMPSDAMPGNIVFIPDGKLSRVDLKAPASITVKYEMSTLDKIQGLLKKPKLTDIQNSVANSVSKVSVEQLNSKEQVDKDTKIKMLREFIEQQQNSESPYDEVLFYSGNQKITDWNGNKIYHSMDSVRTLIFESISSNPRNKFLVVYNPPQQEKTVARDSNTIGSVEVDTLVSVTGVSIMHALTLQPNFTYPLAEQMQIQPANATDKNVSWSSDNPSVATVSEGLVTAVRAGSATITVTTADGGKTAHCIVTVQKTSPSEIKFPCGTYNGESKNGYPEGDGKMTYSRRVQIAKHDEDNPPHYAESGDYFDGSWGNGDIVSGYLYDRSGKIKERIMAPKRFNYYDISND